MGDGEEDGTGAFLDAVKRQYLQDVASYSGRLKAELAKVEQDDNGSAKLGDIKRIISSFDERKTLMTCACTARGRTSTQWRT